MVSSMPTSSMQIEASNGKTAQIHTQTDLHSGDFFGCNIIGPPEFKGNKLFLIYHTSSKTISNK